MALAIFPMDETKLAAWKFRSPRGPSNMCADVPERDSAACSEGQPVPERPTPAGPDTCAEHQSAIDLPDASVRVPFTTESDTVRMATLI